MNWLDLPPLAALRAFAAFAEHGSVQRAGDALNVSHAAISQHIRKLEAHTGLALLDRRARKAELTADGTRLAEALAQGFDVISQTLALLTGAEEDRPLRVTTTPTFAANWLVPRLAAFRHDYPQIDVIFDAGPDLVDLGRREFDMAVRFGRGDWEGLDAFPLVTCRMVAVASPLLLPQHQEVTLEDLRQLPILQEKGTSENTNWLARHGLEEAGRGGRVELPGHLTLDAARAGQGIAVAAEAWVLADLEAGRLVKLFEDPVDFGYFAVTRREPHRAALKAFLRWLRSEAE